MTKTLEQKLVTAKQQQEVTFQEMMNPRPCPLLVTTEQSGAISLGFSEDVRAQGLADYKRLMGDLDYWDRKVAAYEQALKETNGAQWRPACLNV
ncbi:hypothetical protein [Subtercola vilae]|uniref:Uncharacterized protein n=1 Tax=Subtercola vilae TaxID=2056433 RepID=A0A4T2BZ87_9MICO|nr:hypothetical protein [Subtercola vilae]TIH34958.1 hypothetical protein D4765_11735 [Subtercola vilae]